VLTFDLANKMLYSNAFDTSTNPATHLGSPYERGSAHVLQLLKLLQFLRLLHTYRLHSFLERSP